MTEKTLSSKNTPQTIKVRRPDANPTAATPVVEETASAPVAEVIEVAAAPEVEAPPVVNARRVFDPAEPEPEPEPEAVETVESGAAQEAEAAADFAALFEAQESRPHTSVQVGQSVEGTLIEIGQEYAFVDLGRKAEATLSRIDLLDADGELTAKVGDRIRAIVIDMRSGEIRLGTKIQRGDAAALDTLAAAHDGMIPVEGRVTGINKGGYEVDVMGVRAFCPLSQIEQSYTENPEEHLEATYTFRVIEFGERGRKVVLSRAALQREEAAERAVETRKLLAVDAVLEGTIRSLKDYGAFVDIGGLDGLVHISEIVHGHIKHPSDVLSEGETVNVKVLSITQTEKGEKISLSIKRASGDPWLDVDQWLGAGEVYTGTVSRLAPFGAFVELKPGIEGLIHVSEMSWERRVHHPSDVLQDGEAVEVAVLNIDAENRRISLSLKAAQGNPWDEATERYPVGEVRSGVIESIADFGVFVRLEPGLVGLIPLSELGTSPGSPPSKDFKIDQTVEAIVLSVDEERRRLSLSRKAMDEDQPIERRAQAAKRSQSGPRGEGRPQRKNESRGGGGGGARSHREAGRTFATFGDLLMNKLNDSKEKG